MLKTYDPKQVSVIVGGFIISGFADGSFVPVARNNDTFTLLVGADGDATRSKSNDKSGTFVITLQQTSASNAVLAGIAAADELGNSGIVPVLIKDNSGNALHTAAQAWIRKYPDADFAKEGGNLEWTLETSNLIMAPLGN